MNAVAHENLVKIEQQAGLFAGQPQVCQYLRHVNGQNFLNTLDLNHDALLNKNVNPIPAVKSAPVVQHGQRNLSLNTQPALREFMRQTRLICRFEQARAKLAMNSDRRSDDLTSEGVISAPILTTCSLLHGLLCVLCVSAVIPYRGHRILQSVHTPIETIRT